MRVLTAVDEFAQLQDRSTRRLVEALERTQRATMGGTDRNDALRSLARLYAETYALADLLGRRRVLLEADARLAHAEKYQAGIVRGPGGALVIYAGNPVIPAVPFAEAVADMIAREPRLARSGEEVSRLYNSGNFFAMAYSSDLLVTKKVQEMMARGIREGGETLDHHAAIQAAGDWTRSYSETVYRTGLNTAYTSGRLAIARDPAVAEEFPGFRYTATLDGDTTARCRAGDGLVFSTRDPLVKYLSPPWHYNCRATIELVDRDEMRAAGLIDANGSVRFLNRSEIPEGAGPDPGFRP